MLIPGGGLFVKIHTNQGIWGCGEGVDAIPELITWLNRLGQNKGTKSFNPKPDCRAITESQFFRWGTIWYVRSCYLLRLNAALWDLSGKALGLPVYQLLGGKFRDKVRVYCDTELYTVNRPMPEDYAKAALDAIKRGYTAVKFDIDQANDPNKYDKFNWTASNAELERMYDSIAAYEKK